MKNNRKANNQASISNDNVIESVVASIMAGEAAAKVMKKINGEGGNEEEMTWQKAKAKIIIMAAIMA